MNNNFSDKMAKLAINKSLLKEYSNSSNERIVYMNDGSEFQIQIFNSKSYTIGVGFSFNDEYDSSYQLLVLRPGERVWLDRYLNKENKLLFSTYEVGTSKAVKEAIKNNGKITIKFYKERQYEQHYTITSTPWYNVNYNTYTGDTIKEYSSALTTDINTNSYLNVNKASLNAKLNDDYSNINSSIQFCNNSLDLNSNVTGTATSAATYTSYGATIQTNACIDKSTSTNDSISTYNTSKPLRKVRSRSMETGRIESGSHSNQKFNKVYNNFETFPFKTETILILPTSRKPVTPNDLEKKYCYNCGRKLNKKFTYCPFCGAKQ